MHCRQFRERAMGRREMLRNTSCGFGAVALSRVGK